jgi:hypothetical protein
MLLDDLGRLRSKLQTEVAGIQPSHGLQSANAWTIPLPTAHTAKERGLGMLQQENVLINLLAGLNQIPQYASNSMGTVDSAKTAVSSMYVAHAKSHTPSLVRKV